MISNVDVRTQPLARRTDRVTGSLCWRVAALSVLGAGLCAAGLGGFALWPPDSVLPLLACKLGFALGSVGALSLTVCAVALRRETADAWTAKALLLAASTALALAAGEAAVRFALRDVTTTADNRSVFARRWNAAHVQLNALGFREREVDGKAAGAYRIAMVGDSFTFGQGLKVGDRFSDRVQLARPALEVLNFGVPGAETVDELVTLQRAVLPQAPDFVLLQWYVNDLEGRDKSLRPTPPPLWDHWAAGLLGEHSALYYLANHRWQALSVSGGRTESYDAYMVRRFGDPGGAAFRGYAETFRAFVAAARGAGVPVGVVLFPDPSTDAYGGLHDAMLALCAETGTDCLDLRATLGQAAASGVPLRLGPLDGHPSAAANAVATGAILGHFEARWHRTDRASR